MLAFMSCTRIDPGYTGFKVSYGGDYRGTDSLPQRTGRVYYMPGFSTVIEFPTFMQHKVWTEATNEGSPVDEAFIVGCKGGASFKMDVGLNYQIKVDRAAHIYFKFKATDVQDLHDGYLRNSVRNVLNNLAGDAIPDSLLEARPAYEKEAQRRLAELLEPDGFYNIQLSILQPPKAVDPALQTAINRKISAKQDAERTVTELQSSQAQAQKDIAKARGDSAALMINAQATALANQKMQQSLTPLLIDKMRIEKWDGHYPTYMLSPSSGTILNLK